MLPDLKDWECVKLELIETPEYLHTMMLLRDMISEYPSEHPERKSIEKHMDMVYLKYTYYLAHFQRYDDPTQKITHTVRQT